MTTELTKAAQQAPKIKELVEQLRNIANGVRICGVNDRRFVAGRLDEIADALTQRPAAQTEREAFEGWARPNGYDLRRNDVLGHYSSIDTSRAWSRFRELRASLPAPQQATPEQPSGFEGRVIVGQIVGHSKHRGGWFVYEECSPGEYDPIKGPFPSRESADAAMRDPNAPLIQQATPERHLTVTTNQRGEAVMVSWQDDEHRILDVVWERKPATPEPLHLFEFWWESHMPQATQSQAWAAWTAAQNSKGAAIEAPQQATPDLADGPARMHWTNWMPVKDALEYAYQKMGLEMVKTDAGAKYPNLHWNLAGLVREFVVAQQDAMFGKCQACGKNVGLLDQIKCLDCGTRLCEPCAKEHFGSDHGARAAASHSHPAPTTSGWVETSAPPQRLDWSDTQQATPEPVGEVFLSAEDGKPIPKLYARHTNLPDGTKLFTRPAPGVPEGWRNVIAGTLKTDPWDSARVADYNSGWNDCQRKTLRGLERLAAAQAKGGAA